MRIGIILSDYTPSKGGAFTFQGSILRSLFQAATESKHQFILFSPSDYLEDHKSIPRNCILSKFTPNPSIDKIKLKIRREVRRFNQLSILQIPLEKRLLNEKVDICWFLGGSGVELDIPYIATIWDLQHRLQPWFPEVSSHGEWSNRENAYRYYLQRATLILVPNERAREEVELFYQVPSERIKILPHPMPDFVENIEIEETQRVIEKFQLQNPFIYYPAQFWPHKNHINLLYVLRFLRDEHNLIFHLVFSGSDKGNMAYVRKTAIALDIHEQVQFLGFVSQKELISLYKAAFALVFPSFFGPENLPPLEALALGCPVICADYSGAKEQLGDAAILVNPVNVNEMASAIIKIYDKPNVREELIRKGYLRAQKWTSTDFVKNVISFLDEFEIIRRCWL